MTALKCSLRRMPSAPVQESARPSSKVSKSGRGGRWTGLFSDKVDERLQVDCPVAGMLDLRHLLGEVLGADAVGGVRGI